MVRQGAVGLYYVSLLIGLDSRLCPELSSKGLRWPVVTINTTKWLVEAQTRPFRSFRGMTLLNFQLYPLYDADHDVVAPHGLIGQSWDGDGIGIDGAQDNYT